MFARSLLKLAIILAGTVFVVDAGIEPVSAVPEPAAYETAWVAPEGGAKDCELAEGSTNGSDPIPGCEETRGE